jgi:hypothetical protein
MTVENYKAGVTIDPARAEANVAFHIAIEQGRLSADPAAPNYAGNYMFMGRAVGRDQTARYFDQFKHIATRQYLPRWQA